MKSIINKNYSKLLYASFITRFGDGVDSIAFSWLVYLMTGSKVLMGSIFAVSVFPNLILMPFGGLLADTLNKRKIVYVCDILRGLSVATLAIMHLYSALEVWHLFFFVALNTIIESFAYPARSTMLQSVVEKTEYVKATGYLSTATNLGTLLGISFATTLIAVVGIWGTMVIDSASFLISALLIFVIKFKDIRTAVKKNKTIKSSILMIKEGFIELKNNKLIREIIILSAIFNFAVVPFRVLRPFYVQEVLNKGVEGVSAMAFAILFGMTIGGFIVGRFANFKKYITIIGLGQAMMGVVYILLAVPDSTNFMISLEYIFVLTMCFIWGFLLPVVQAPIQHLFMTRIKPDLIGRFTAISNVFANLIRPLGGIFVSLVGDSISTSNVLIIMGVILIVGSCTYYINNVKYDKSGELIIKPST